jgi:hypothetical protein
MSQAYPLDSIIRRLDPEALPTLLGPDEKLVIFDARTCKALEKKPFLAFGRDLRYYLVCTRRLPLECRGPVLKLKSKTMRLTCNVEFSYEVRCERGNEEKLVASLHRGEHPGVMLDELLVNGMEDFVNDPANATRDICLDLLELRAEVEAYLAERALAELGVSLEAHLWPQHEDKLQPQPAKSGFFPIRLKDHDREINLKFTTDIEVDPDNRMRAVLRYPQVTTLEEKLKQVIRQTLAKEVTLHQFCYELTGTVRSQLIETINQSLEGEGREVTYLLLESPALDLRPPQLEEIEHLVECVIRDCEEKIQVVHRLQLSLCNLGRLRATGITNLGNWAKARLTDISRSVLFDKTYLDLLLAPGWEVIKGAMEHEAAVIGYAVKQLIVVPHLPPLTWKDALPIDQYESSYVTKDSRVEVRLNIVVKGQIVNLKSPKLERYLRPSSKIADDMKETIRRETQMLMHRIDPERFYMRFDIFENGERPVREEIEEHLSKVLTERFDVAEISVVAKPLETDLSRRLSALQERPQMLEVSNLSFPDHGGSESVTYRIIYKIAGVHESGWHTFRSLRFTSADEELASIKEILGECVKERFETVPGIWLQYKDYKTKSQLQEVVSAAAADVLNTFGLSIDITGVRREETEGELSAQRKLQAAIRESERVAVAAAEKTGDSALQLLNMLNEKVHGLIEADAESSDEHLVNAQKRKKRLQDELLAYPSKEDKKQFKSLPAAAASDFRFEDYQPKALGTGEAKRPLRSEGEGETS